MAPMRLRDLVAAPRAALVLQEVQEGVIGEGSVFPALAGEAAEVGVVPNASRLAVAARAAGVPVIHATAENLPGGFGVNRNARLFVGARAAGADNLPGTPAVRPVAGIAADGDIVLPRYHGLSPLTGAPLDSLLRNHGVTTVVVAGVSLNIAIPNLVFDAVNRAYQVVVATDAVAGVPGAYGRQVLDHTIALLATLATTDEIVTAWSTTS
jgi:nicotinamidase-related amidase